MSSISGDSSKKPTFKLEIPQSAIDAALKKAKTKPPTTSKAKSAPKTTTPKVSTTKKAFSSSSKSKTRSRFASRELTNQQSETSQNLTGSSTAGKPRSNNSFLSRLPEEDRQAIEASKKPEPTQSNSNFISRLPEEDRRAIEASKKPAPSKKSAPSKKKAKTSLINRLPEEDRQAIRDAEQKKLADETRDDFIDRLPEEDRQDIIESREARAEAERRQFINRLPEEDRQAIQEAEEAREAQREADRNNFINRLPEEDRQAIQEAQEINEVRDQIAEADTPAEQVEILAEHVEAGDVDTHRLLEAAGPEVVEGLSEAEKTEVSQAIDDLSEIVDDDEEAAAIVAEQLTDNPPLNFPGFVHGLATASADGHSDLATAVAEDIRESGERKGIEEAPQAAIIIEQAAALEETVNDVRSSVTSGDLEGSVEATEIISQAIDNAPPEIAQALVGELDENGSLAGITNSLQDAALDVDAPLPDHVRFHQDFGPLEDGQSLSDRESFDRVVAQLSLLSSAAGDDQSTDLIGARIANVIGDDIGRFDEAFELAVGSGFGAGLAADVATRIHANGEVSSSANLVEGVERGADTLAKRIDDAADRVDESNGDLAYLLTQWGDFYGDDEDGRAALAERVEAFQNGEPQLDANGNPVLDENDNPIIIGGRSEYAELNELSANVGQDLEALRDLQGLFPEKQHLKDRELDLLGDASRWGATENGRLALAEAVERSGMGEQTFIDRFMDEDFRNSLSDGDLEDLGFENFDQFKDTVAQHTLSGSFGLMAEAGRLGDDYRLNMVGKGLVNQADFLGEDAEVLEALNGAMADSVETARTVANSGSAIAEKQFKAQLEKFDMLSDDLVNPATRTKFRVGNGLLGLVAGGLSWHQVWDDGFDPMGGAAAVNATLEGVLNAAEQRALHTGRSVLGRFSAGGLEKAGRLAGGVGVVLDGIGVYQALQDGDYVQAGISGLGALGSLVGLAGSTGVGLAIGVGAAALGIAYGQYRKVEASNRFESEEAERFIAGALDQSGVRGSDQFIGDITNHLRNADSEGRQTGVLIQQAAERGGVSPQELLRIIATQDPSDILKIVEAGHGVDPEGDGLDSLTQSDTERDERVGELRGHRSGRRYGPETVEGFLVWLAQQGYIDRNNGGDIVL